MNTVSQERCLASREFTSYLMGTAYSREKRRIEQHLSHCDFCFEVFISAFNDYLDEGIGQNESIVLERFAGCHA
jgi:hypothetical protein